MDSVPEVLDFYRRALEVEPRFVDLDVQLEGREPSARYQVAILDFPGATVQFATHALGRLLMPLYSRPSSGGPSGVEIAFYTEDVLGAFARAVAAGAEAVAELKQMPWGQSVAYVRSLEGTFLGICSPLSD